MLALLGQYTSNTSSSSSGGGVGVLFFFVTYAAVIVLVIAGMWKMFVKAGQQGWLSIIPILNTYVIIKLAGREGWWILLFLIPCVNIVVAIIVYMDLAQKYGKSAAYGLGLVFLPFIFIPMLGFGSATYQGDPARII